MEHTPLTRSRSGANSKETAPSTDSLSDSDSEGSSGSGSNDSKSAAAYDSDELADGASANLTDEESSTAIDTGTGIGHRTRSHD